MTHRGIVLLPTVTKHGPNSVTTYGLQTLTPLLRKLLLYYERLEVPNNNLIHMGSTPEMNELESLGVLSRTDIRIERSGPLVELWLWGLFSVYAKLNVEEPGQWCLAQSGEALEVPAEFATGERGLQFELISALPIPDESVPFLSILEFRERRASELAALRVRIDELYQQVLSAPDSESARIAAIENLELAIADIRRCSQESFLTKILGSAKLEFNAGSMVGGLMGLLAGEFPMNVLTGLGGGILSSIKVEKGGFVPKGSSKEGSYAFVEGVVKELEAKQLNSDIVQLGLRETR